MIQGKQPVALRLPDHPVRDRGESDLVGWWSYLTSGRSHFFNRWGSALCGRHRIGGPTFSSLRWLPEHDAPPIGDSGPRCQTCVRELGRRGVIK